MRVGIIGLPGSGKSTVFAAATGTPPDPATHAEVRRAVVKVPDKRLDYLSSICHPKKYTEATIEFVDVPGGAAGEGAGTAHMGLRKHLPEIRQCDALAVVVRGHTDPAAPRYKDRVDPAAEMVEIWDELIFADLDSVTTRVERLEKSLKKPSKTHDQDKHELALLTRCQHALEAGEPLASVLHNEDERRQVSSFAFVTQKPLVVICNVGEDHIEQATPPLSEHARETIVLCATAEAEIAALDPADRAAFLEDLHIQTPARDRLVQACYRALGLISFLTMGPDEVRAWPVRGGSTAVEAAGKIHSDLARGFIRAETVAYHDLVAHGDLRGAKAAGKVRQEGKGYIVADGDVLNIKFNV